jgi:hypothetical protein
VCSTIRSVTYEISLHLADPQPALSVKFVMNNEGRIVDIGVKDTTANEPHRILPRSCRMELLSPTATPNIDLGQNLGLPGANNIT